MSDLLNMGLSAASGGVFGLIGTLGGRVAGYFEKKQSNAHDLKLREFKQKQNEHDLVLLDKEFAHEERLHEINMREAAQETESELAITAKKGSWAGMSQSIAHDIAGGLGSIWVQNTLRLVRPILTFLLWVITAWIFKHTQDENIANAAVFAATAATLWWFGDRAPSQNVLLRQGG